MSLTGLPFAETETRRHGSTGKIDFESIFHSFSGRYSVVQLKHFYDDLHESHAFDLVWQSPRVPDGWHVCPNPRLPHHDVTNPAFYFWDDHGQARWSLPPPSDVGCLPGKVHSKPEAVGKGKTAVRPRSTGDAVSDAPPAAKKQRIAKPAAAGSSSGNSEAFPAKFTRDGMNSGQTKKATGGSAAKSCACARLIRAGRVFGNGQALGGHRRACPSRERSGKGLPIGAAAASAATAEAAPPPRPNPAVADFNQEYPDGDHPDVTATAATTAVSRLLVSLAPSDGSISPPRMFTSKPPPNAGNPAGAVSEGGGLGRRPHQQVAAPTVAEQIEPTVSNGLASVPSADQSDATVEVQPETKKTGHQLYLTSNSPSVHPPPISTAAAAATHLHGDQAPAQRRPPQASAAMMPANRILPFKSLLVHVQVDEPLALHGALPDHAPPKIVSCWITNPKLTFAELASSLCAVCPAPVEAVTITRGVNVPQSHTILSYVKHAAPAFVLFARCTPIVPAVREGLGAREQTTRRDGSVDTEGNRPMLVPPVVTVPSTVASPDTSAAASCAIATPTMSAMHHARACSTLNCYVPGCQTAKMLAAACFASHPGVLISANCDGCKTLADYVTGLTVGLGVAYVPKCHIASASAVTAGSITSSPVPTMAAAHATAPATMSVSTESGAVSPSKASGSLLLSAKRRVKITESGAAGSAVTSSSSTQQSVRIDELQVAGDINQPTKRGLTKLPLVLRKWDGKEPLAIGHQLQTQDRVDKWYATAPSLSWAATLASHHGAICPGNWGVA